MQIIFQGPLMPQLLVLRATNGNKKKNIAASGKTTKTIKNQHSDQKEGF